MDHKGGLFSIWYDILIEHCSREVISDIFFETWMDIKLSEGLRKFDNFKDEYPDIFH